ncbi:hypothetical protein CLU79DRAFT_849419 [Phycomyces nitens]|nr:hypothetical protein CLU79DRAFT_849419 [Phycomyces nitens]
MKFLPRKTLREDIIEATKILEEFTENGSKSLIPRSVLANAHGLIILKSYKGSAGVSYKEGSGIIIARNPDRTWSAPSSLSLIGGSAGNQFGFGSNSLVIVMNYRAAIKSFLQGGNQFELDASFSLAFGPHGRTAGLSIGTSNGDYGALTYTYSKAKGIFWGYSIGGAKLSEQPGENAIFYQRPISVKDILEKEPRPTEAARIYKILEVVCHGSTAQFGSKSLRAPSIAAQSDTGCLPPTYSQNPNGEEYHVGSNNENLDTIDNRFHFNNLPQGYPTMLPSQNNNAPPSLYENSGSFDPGNAPYVSENTINENCNTQYESSGPPTPPSEPAFGIAVSVNDYRARSSNEISFSRGNRIIVRKRSQNGQVLHEGEIGGRRGYYPVNYTRLLFESDS